MMPSKRPSPGDKRKSSTLHYQTFPTKPPVSRGRPPSDSEGPGGSDGHNGSDAEERQQSPLPTRQLAVLAVIALAEQTAMNSISPYLPAMASTFPEVKEDQVGLYVGLIASSFALAQFATNFFWGWLSDRIGRKPVILLGTLFTAGCFLAFGFCKTLWQAIIVQALMGLLNGNQGVVSTCLGEITDRSNQSRAFTYLPVVYGVGAITGPAVGGLLVTKSNPFHKDRPNPYPYLLPNVFASVVLVVDLVVTMLFLEESLEEAKNLPPLGKRFHNLFARLWQFTSSSRPTYLRKVIRERHDRRQSGHAEDDEHVPDDTESSAPALFPDVHIDSLKSGEVLRKDTILLMITYFIFQLSNISYNSLYPIFAQASPPAGRDLSPREIGLSLSFAGFFTIIFQICIYGKLRNSMGNKTTYRASLVIFVVAFVLIPWVGYKDGQGIFQGKVWLWIELGFVLMVKTVAAVGGLTSALLLITNSAPNHNVLGTLNGLAQTLSAAGRATGPFVSGSLFSAATRVKPKGEALAFGLFGGIAFLGFLLSLGIRGEELEADGFDESTDEEAGAEEDDGVHSDSNERSRLL